jgi:hypothetical protein
MVQLSSSSSSSYAHLLALGEEYSHIKSEKSLKMTAVIFPMLRIYTGINSSSG